MNQYLLLASGIAPIRNGDVHYPFRVNSDFLAWTGMDIEGAILLHDHETQEQILFFDEPDNQKRLWESIRWDIASIRRSGFVGQILPRSMIWEYLSWLDGEFFLPNNNLPSTVLEYQSLRDILFGKCILDATQMLIQNRIIKSDSDIAKIRNSIKITEETYQYILENAQVGMYEYEIEAMIAYQFRLHQGIEAFPSIVASGPNACTLHYTANTRRIEVGDLILMDFGIELDGYGADISRTFTIGGSMNSRQQELYDAVLEVKQFAVKTLTPGITRKDWNLRVKEYMFTVCQNLSLPDMDIYTPTTNPYFPHSIGHFLGLDTHDVGNSDIPFLPGMILTIEPGIYIRHEGIGIRIEDDYLVTEDGCVRL